MDIEVDDLSPPESPTVAPPAAETMPSKPAYVTMKQELAAADAAQKELAMAEGIQLEQPKKKKKRKPKKKNATPSGFEDYFAEAPLTPEQALETAKLYSTTIPLSTRIETCIQRYRARRRWDPFRHQLFTHYLTLGGIRSGQKAYGGGIDLNARAESDDEGPDAADVAMQTATDYVGKYEVSNRNRNDWKGKPGVFEDDEEEWWVDFEYVVKAFLSHKVPHELCLHTEADLELAVKLVRNFLNYVIFHNVAPEYNQNILKAIEVCNLADKELLLCNEVAGKLPGKFNTACSALFGGYYHGLYESDMGATWEGKNPKHMPLGLPIEDAHKLFCEALSVIGTEEQKQTGLDGVTLFQKDAISFEIQKINVPGPEAPGGPLALGSIEVEIWAPEGERLPNTNLKKFTIYLERLLLTFMFPHMKLEAIIYTLSSGMHYMDTVTGVYCSFYTYLEVPPQGEIGDDETDDA